MWDIAAEVLRAAQALGIRAEPLTVESSAALWSSILQRYAAGNDKWPLWEHLRNDIGVQLVDGWKLLPRFLGTGGPLALVFEPADERRYIRFHAAPDIVRTLEDCFRFEFYVTDDSLSFLLCFNHHDFLIGAGLAREWVKSLRC
jgi:hypothetical protein